MLTTLNISGRVRVFSITSRLRAPEFRVRNPVETKIPVLIQTGSEAQKPAKMGIGSPYGAVKGSERAIDQPSPPCVQFKERVELYLPLCALWNVTNCTLFYIEYQSEFFVRLST